MLWEITSPSMQKVSYLFGTFHTRDPKLSRLPFLITSKLKKSQRLYTEIPMTSKSTQEIFLFSKMTHPITIKQRLHPKTIKLLRKQLQAYKLPYTLKTLKPFKTWAIALMLSNQKEDTHYTDMLFMDEKIVAYAKKEHIQQASLETPIEQLRYFDSLSVSLQEQFLLTMLTKEKDSAYEDALKAWYRKGKAQGFLALQKHFASKNPRQQKLDKILTQGLLIARNLRFTRRIHILLENNSSLHYFFAIGAGHMSGKKGILEQLRQQGYTIKKIN